MVIVHNKTKRKPTGGRYKDVKPKRLAQRGSLPTHTRIGKNKVKVKDARGSNSKKALISAEKVNVHNPKTNKAFKADLKNVTDNEASRHFVRRNIITKGAVIETSKGKARVTNRPGQDGIINAVLIKE